MSGLSAHAIDLVQAALLASFWRHEALRRFLRRNGVSENALAHLTKDLTKRQFLDWLFPRLEASDKGTAVIRQTAKQLSEQMAFPDLEGWPDSQQKIDDAKQRITELRRYLDRENNAKTDEQERARLRSEAAERRERNQSHSSRLSSLKLKLERDLLPLLGTQDGGYRFQDWFAELANIFELPHKKPYKTPDGREVDGSITVEGMTYLLSLKFTNSPTAPSDISEFQGRFSKVADYTMGIVLSMSGHSEGAIAAASGSRTNIILLDHSHLYSSMMGISSLGEIVTRSRQHASRTGQAHLPVAEACS